MTQNMQQIILSLEGIWQAYPQRVVLKNFNLQLEEGKFYLLMGSNGAGKTTLLKLISGLIKPLKGSLNWSPKYEGTSLFLGDTSLYEDLTLEENISLFAPLYHAKSSWVSELLKLFSLEDLLNLRLRYFSKGQKVRASLCRSFLPHASLYLLDEPFSGLDAESINSLLSFLKKIKNEKKTILLISHSTQYLEALIDSHLTL